MYNNKHVHQNKNSKNSFQKLTQDNYFNMAEKIIDELINRKKLLSTSKIRSILSLNMQIYDMVVHSKSETLSEDVSEDVKAKLQYLKVKIVYEMGREQNVKNFAEEANLLKHIDNIHNKSDYILFARYMEALVAFRKYKGGKDQ